MQDARYLDLVNVAKNHRDEEVDYYKDELEKTKKDRDEKNQKCMELLERLGK